MGINKSTLHKELIKNGAEVSRQTISNWENGIFVPKILHLFALAKILKLQPNDFYLEKNKKSKSKIAIAEEYNAESYKWIDE